jgi:hypothetical protein
VALTVQTAAREREYILLENRGEGERKIKEGEIMRGTRCWKTGKGGAAEEGGEWRGK